MKEKWKHVCTWTQAGGGDGTHWTRTDNLGCLRGVAEVGMAGTVARKVFSVSSCSLKGGLENAVETERSLP